MKTYIDATQIMRIEGSQIHLQMQTTIWPDWTPDPRNPLPQTCKQWLADDDLLAR